MRKPENSKFSKKHRHRGYSRGSKVQQCKWPTGTAQLALVALGSGRVTPEQLEAGRVVIARGTLRRAKVTIPCFPDFPITKKGTNSRMGKGKGKVDRYVFVACPGDILFTVEGNPATTTKKAFAKWNEVLAAAGVKLPFETAVVSAPRFPLDQPW